MSYIYNGRFEGNILVVGRAECGKTGFVQKLAVNKFFGELVKAEWMSCIKLDKQKELLKKSLKLQIKTLFLIVILM